MLFFQYILVCFFLTVGPIRSTEFGLLFSFLTVVPCTVEDHSIKAFFSGNPNINYSLKKSNLSIPFHMEES